MNVRERLEAMLKPNEDGLLPCERCGMSDPEELAIERIMFADGDRRVVCSCGFLGPTKRGAPYAIAAWNSRPLIRALLTAIEQRNSFATRHADSFDDMSGEIPECDARLLAILEGRES